MTRRPIEEVAPRAFEIALHFTAAAAAGRLGSELSRDQVMSHPVRDARGGRIAPSVVAAIDHFGFDGRFTVLTWRAVLATSPCTDPDPHVHGGEVLGAKHDFVLVDVVVGGEAWTAAGRIAWTWPHLAEGRCSRHWEALVVVVEEPASDGLTCARLRPDVDMESEALWRVCRHALVQETLLRHGVEAACGVRTP